jgi:hypothetical protein
VLAEEVRTDCLEVAGGLDVALCVRDPVSREDDCLPVLFPETLALPAGCLPALFPETLALPAGCLPVLFTETLVPPAGCLPVLFPETLALLAGCLPVLFTETLVLPAGCRLLVELLFRFRFPLLPDDSWRLDEREL